MGRMHNTTTNLKTIWRITLIYWFHWFFLIKTNIKFLKIMYIFFAVKHSPTK